MDFFLYKGPQEHDGFGAPFRFPEQRTDLELLDDIRNVKTEDLDLFFPEPRVEVGPYDCGLYMPGDETSVSIPIPHLLPSDHLPLKEEQQKLVIETPKKCKNAKRKRNMDAPSATTKKPQLSCMKSVPKKSKASRPAKRVKVTQVEETEKTKKAKKSHKRQRVTKAERNRLKTEYERFIHYRNQAFLPKTKSPAGANCLCPFPGCSYKSQSMDMLKDHMELHKAGQKRHFLCTECKEVFYSSGCLTSHAITHSRGGSTKFCCQAVGCGKRYATAEGLRLHTRNHHQVNKTWKCMAENCDISFVRKSDLQMHIIRMHSKERPYPCTQKGCAKSFACHSELRRHLLKIHEVECPKLPKDGSLDRPKSDIFERLIKEATVHRDHLRKQRALEKARLQKERKALLRLQKAAAREAKRAAKKKATKKSKRA